MAIDYLKAEEAFNKYVKNYDINEEYIYLKYDHTLKVANLMDELAHMLKLSNNYITLAKIIGLLHDIGRFEQITKYKDWHDLKTQDHAEIGVNYLFNEGHIRDFIDDSSYDEIIRNAIKYHNKYEIPKFQDERVVLFTKMIRDMDKVDIYRVMSVYFNEKYGFDEVSKEVLSSFKAKRCVDLKYVKTNSDNVIKTLAFMYDINFNESFKILEKTGNIISFANSVDVSTSKKNEFDSLINKVIKMINRKIEIER